MDVLCLAAIKIDGGHPCCEEISTWYVKFSLLTTAVFIELTHDPCVASD
jgi:hypothetical protein